MSKVASAFLRLTGTNPQEGLGGPPPPPLCLPPFVEASTLSSQSRDIHNRWSRDSQLLKFMNVESRSAFWWKGDTLVAQRLPALKAPVTHQVLS